MSSEIQTLIANIVFPIVISIYLLIRIDGKLQMIGYSFNKLIKNINIMNVK